MPGHDVNTQDGQKVIAKIDAAIEAAALLPKDEAEKALGGSVESLVASLGGKGSVAVKQAKRDAFRAAAAAEPGPVVPDDAYEHIDGVKALVDMGAAKVKEGFKAQRTASSLALDLAKIVLDIWSRIPDAEGNPDLRGNSARAKAATRDMLTEGGKGQRRTDANEEILGQLARAVQEQRQNYRARMLRELDGDGADRSAYAGILKGKPRGVPASRHVADYYGLSLVGPAEKRRLRRTEDRVADGTLTALPEDMARIKDIVEIEGANALTADDRAAELVSRISRDVARAKPDDLSGISDEARDKIRDELVDLQRRINDMIAAVL